MYNHASENAANAPKSGATEPSYRDWREERRQWRQKMRESRHGVPFFGLFWGMTLVLLGVLFLLNRTGHLHGDAWWQYLLIGLGVISIVNGIVNYRYRGYPWFSYGRFTGGIILILIGTLFLIGFSQWWPLALVVAGAALLVRFFWHWI